MEEDELEAARVETAAERRDGFPPCLCFTMVWQRNCSKFATPPHVLLTRATIADLLYLIFLTIADLLYLTLLK
jgi:hypothetical protein